MLTRERVSIGAHRGWRSNHSAANSLSAINEGAQRADFVEVDLRLAADGYVVWHDPTIRLPHGILPRRVSRLSTRSLRHAVADQNKGPLVRACDLFRHYPWGLGKPLLLDLKFGALPEDLIWFLRRFPALCCFGARTTTVLEQCFSITSDRGRIVAMPKFPWQIDAFIKAGAGVVRLWQHGASQQNLDYLRRHNVQSLVMIGNRFYPGLTNRERLTDVLARHPDFVLMDDPAEGLYWRSYV